jgi:hypothetical protein
MARKKPRVKVTAHAATVAKIRVPNDRGYDLKEVAKYFISKGVPHALSLVILAWPRGAELNNDDYRVVWYEDNDAEGVFLTIEVTIIGEAQGHFYLGEGT